MNSDENLQLLAKSILKIRNKQEAVNYFKDLFSNKELETLILRLRIAKMLYEGTSYVEIERETGASSATIAKISEAIKYGHEGLSTILERMKRAR